MNMNKEEKLPEHINRVSMDYQLVFYLTGNKPLEFGYMLFENGTKVKDNIIGRVIDEAVLNKVYEEIDLKVNDFPTSAGLILEARWVNKNFFPAV